MHWILIIVIVLLVLALIPIPLLLLWNWLMPTIFGLTKITYWQSLGLLILSSILFRSPGGGSSKS